MQIWQSNVKNIPTYPAPTQQIFFTPPPLDLIAASRDVLPVLCFPCPEAASSRASCNFKACKTGLNVKLPSGVVGAVDISNRLSSAESMLEDGMDRFLYILGAAREVTRREIVGYCAPFVSGRHQQ
jgi:hypothetical protein